MTANSSSRNSQGDRPQIKSPLRVVDPTGSGSITKSAKGAKSSPTPLPIQPSGEEEDGNNEEAKPRRLKWILWGVTGGLLAASLIPFPVTIGALRTTFDTLPERRRDVDMPVDGVIQIVAIESGEPVRQGQELFQVRADNARDQLAEKRRSLSEAQSLLQEERGKLSQVTNQTAILETRFSQADQRFRELQASLAPTAGRRRADMAIRQAEIQRLKNQLPGLRARRLELENQIAIAQVGIERARPMVAEGAVSQQRLETQLQEQSALRGRLETLIQEGDDITGQIAVAEGQLNNTAEDLTDELKDLRNERDRLELELQAARSQVPQQERLIQQRQATVTMLRQEVADLEQRLSASNTVIAEIDGVVLTSDDELAGRRGRYFPQGEPLARIAGTEELEAVIEVDVADRELMAVGDTVWIDPLSTEAAEIRGTIDRIDAESRLDETQQRSIHRVYVSVQNPNQTLKPNERAHARVETQARKTVWERIWAEADKLIFNKYGWW